MAWSDPKTWTADDLLTASDLNQYVSDNLSALYALVQGGGRKNLLHNGAMQVAQRGASSTGIIVGAGTPQTADRWYFDVVSMGTWTVSVEADAPTGSGFRKSLKALCTAEQTTPASPAAGDYMYVEQKIEGQNLQAIKKGTASAEPLTLSFWTKSNKTGTYVVWLYDADNARHVAATYTVASSGTWEQQSITFPADLTGAFDNDNAASLIVRFWLGSGSNSTSGTLATAWAAYSQPNTAVGQTNLAASTNNYWQVTGVQLETGSAATGFEFKDYGTELAECQRYYWQPTGIGPEEPLGLGTYYSASDVYVRMYPPVTMRATPVLLGPTGADLFYTYVTGNVDYITRGAIDAYSTNDVVGATFSGGSRSTGYTAILNATADGWLAFSADL